MKILQLLLIFILTQTSCFAYTRTYTTQPLSPFARQSLYNRGVVTGIPAPIVQYNVPAPPQPYYVNQKHIKKKYRKYYFPSSTTTTTTTGVTILDDD